MRLFSRFIPILLILCTAGLWGLGAYARTNGLGDTPPYTQSYPVLSAYFKHLAQTSGAAHAYDVLRTAALPPNVDLHLLGHVIGAVLYQQQGIDGIKICTMDFRNACSHSIVIGAFLEKGEAALPEIRDACNEAPGGSGAYTMCFHGLGHGILSYVDYDLPKAIELCKKTGTPEHQDREYIECVGGVVMEMQSGIFDPAEWSKQKEKYFKANDPTYLCSADFMPKDARPICYTYLTPYLWQYVGADLGNPTPQDFAKAFPICGTLADKDERDACYGGFGKEFDGLAASRDVRQSAINHLSDESLGNIASWCALAGNAEGVSVCDASAVDSLYWGGENDRSVSERFCSLLGRGDSSWGADCFSELIGDVKTYVSDASYRSSFCAELPAAYTKECSTALGV